MGRRLKEELEVKIQAKLLERTAKKIKDTYQELATENEEQRKVVERVIKSKVIKEKLYEKVKEIASQEKKKQGEGNYTKV